MKKRVGLVILLLGLLVLLGGCGENESGEKPGDGSNWNDLSAAECCTDYFKQVVKYYPDMPIEELAQKYAEHPGIKEIELDVYTEPYPTDYEPYIPGLDYDAVVPHYQKAAFVVPVWNPCLYTSTIFELGEEDDAEAFCKYLREHVDVAWNVCMVAGRDDYDVESVGRYVFFVICAENYRVKE